MLSNMEVQKILDTGLNISRVAELSGTNRWKIQRMIDKGELELYEAFDENYQPNIDKSFSWTKNEDFLDEIVRNAETTDYLFPENDNEDASKASSYCKQVYGDLKNYINVVHTRGVQDSIYKTCLFCSSQKQLNEFGKSSTSFMGVSTSCKSCEVERTGEYLKIDPVRYKHYRLKRQLRMRNLHADLTESEWSKILDKFQNKCAVCSSEKNITKDHYIPVNWGRGETSRKNIIPLCRTCNSSKGDRQLFDSPEKDIIERHLASENGVSEFEYRNYVNWCEENKRGRVRV